MQLNFLIINVSATTHPDEWTVAKLRYYKTSHIYSWFVDMFFITRAGA